MKKILVTLYLLASSSIIYAQMPTPTAFPAGIPVIDPLTMPFLWDSADKAITIWNFYPGAGTVIQVATIIVMVVGYVILLIKLIQQLMDKD